MAKFIVSVLLSLAAVVAGLIGFYLSSLYVFEIRRDLGGEGPFRAFLLICTILVFGGFYSALLGAIYYAFGYEKKN